jgi:hypothetical protein
MSILANRPATPAKPKRQRFFEIVFEIEGDAYKVSVLPCDPSIGKKAFRFRKLAAADLRAMIPPLSQTDCACLLQAGR